MVNKELVDYVNNNFDDNKSKAILHLACGGLIAQGHDIDKIKQLMKAIKDCLVALKETH